MQGIGLVMVVLCAVWAFWPLPELKPILIDLSDGQPENGESDDVQFRGFDLAAFDAGLWNPPPVPVEAEPAPEARPEPLDVRLVAIIEEHGIRKVALYEVTSDRLLILTEGDEVRRHTVASITADSVLLKNGRSERRLRLREEAS